MFTKQTVITILAASAILVALGLGAQQTGPGVYARSAAQAQLPVEANPPNADPERSHEVTIPYPGRLTDANGQPVPDGAYDFTFSLYEAETGGAPLWSETQTDVTVLKGVFNVKLGSVQAILSTALDHGSLWLEVTVRGPGETAFTALAPRQFLSAVTPTSPDSPSAPPSCPHDHWGESWLGSGVGLYARSNNHVGLAGVGTTSMILNPIPLGVFGVYGEGDNIGVYGYSPAGTGVKGVGTMGAGIRGESTNEDGVSGQASASNKSGVYGYNSGSGYGVAGRSVNGWGLEANGKDDGPFTSRKGDLLLGGSYGDVLATGFLRLWSDVDIYATLDANNDGFNSFTIFDGGGSAVFSVDESGSTWASGIKGAKVETANQDQRLLYAMESPEVWFEDFGSDQLVDGQAVVLIESIFAQTVNLTETYHVYLTPLGDCPLYVSEKTPTSFTVRAMGGQTCAIAFDYRIVAKRLGYENVRMEPAMPPQYTIEGVSP